jgi:DNA-binding XRE family transcriptional regulator
MSDVITIVETVRYLTKIWSGIKQRCQNPNDTSYSNYGGRGIHLCGGWENKDTFVRDNFETFPGLGLGYTIERRDVNGNYEPSNCTWATKLEQARNRTTNTKITFRGKDYPTISSLSEELSERLKIDPKTIEARIYYYDEELHGSDFESHVTKPVEVSSKRIPVQFDGRSFPSKNQAAEATGISRTTVTQRMQRYGVDFDEAAKMAPRQNWVSPSACEITYNGISYPTHTALGEFLGIAQATITARCRKYNPEKHGDWDTYISAPLQVVSGKPTLLGQTFESNAAAARHFNIPTNTLCNWLYSKSIEEVETEIKNYGTAKKGVRSKILYNNVEHTQSSLAKLTGINQTTIGRWHKSLSLEDFYAKLNSYQRGER